MKQKRVYFMFILFFLMSSCLPQVSQYKVPLKDAGKVIVYLQPMPQETHKVRFTIGSVSAVRDDGSIFPLSISLNEIKGSELVQIQKFLAQESLPQGSYTGISITISKAFLLGEEGESALFVSEEPINVDFPFNITREKALTLFLTFNVSGAIKDGFSFTPVFSLTTSGRELTNLLGYVSNSGSNIISVFNKKSMQVVGAILTGLEPMGVVLDQQRGRAYVSVSGDDVIEVIDVFRGEIVARITLNFGDKPRELVLTPDGKTLVSVNYGSNTVSIIDTNALFELSRIRVGDKPTSAVIDPLGLKACVMNSRSNTISVIDLSQKRLSATIAVEGTPIRGAFNRNGNSLYVISRDFPNLTVIDTSQLSITNKIFIGPGAVSIKVDTRTDLILVGKKLGGEISVIDPSSMMFIDTIDVGGTAEFMAIDDEENTLFVVLPELRIVRKVNLTSKKHLAEFEVGEGAFAVIVMGER
jgi:YVTN family beta-propeller protein